MSLLLYGIIFYTSIKEISYFKSESIIMYMKSKYNFLYGVSLFSSCLLASLSMHAAHTLNSEKLEIFTRPVVFNRAGLEIFFAEQFNNPVYVEHILPSHFGHLAHFLHFGKSLADPYDFVMTVFDIFHMRLKGTHWVNALSLSLLLEQLPFYLHDICISREQERLEETIKDILYRRFIARFSKFAQNPMDGINSFDTFLQTIDEFIDPTASEISHLINQGRQKKPVLELQTLVSRFVESALEKVIWNPQTQHDSWDSVCILAEQINILHASGIINSQKTVNHLYWTLLYRYEYFLRSAKEILNQDVFDYIKNDLAMNDREWLVLAESEEFLTSKKEYLKYVLWECIADKELGQ